MMVPKTRRYAAITGDGQIVVEEGPMPSPGRGEVLVEVYASLISPGTEMGGVKARRAHPKPDAPAQPFGYSNAGVIVALGEGCDEFEVGMRVACMGGGYALHATYACVPKNLCVPIPENVSFEEAAFNHLAATALQAIRRTEIQIGEYIAIVGLGIIGQVASQLARLSGAYVLALDKLPMRLHLAAENGADRVVNVDEEDAVAIARGFTDGHGLDGAIIAFGGDATQAVKGLLEIMKVAPDTHRMGRITIVGGATLNVGFPTAFGNMDLRASSRPGPGYHDEAWERGADYPDVFVRWTTRRNLQLVIRLIDEGRLRVRNLITHILPLERAPEACERLIRSPNETLGVILKPSY